MDGLGTVTQRASAKAVVAPVLVAEGLTRSFGSQSAVDGV